jgi:nucleotide-binding universal stress UspA family protein
MPEAPAFNSIPTKILVPVDFSLSSRSALEMAADLADHFHAELCLVHVIPMFTSSTLPDFVPETKFLEQGRKDAEGHFAAVTSDLASKGIKVSSCVEEGNDVASNIMEVVDREHADFIVISTHGLTGWHPLVFGSIAEKVVKLAQCPLLLLRSAKPETSAKVRSDRLMEWW